MAAPTAPVDTSSISMDEAGDKMATNGETSSPKGAKKRKGPFHKVKAGSAVVPIYRTESSKMFGNIVRRATVPEVVAELLKIRKQDGASDAYLGQLRTTLNRLATKFPGPILEVTGPDVDAWLRSLDIMAVTRNSMLRCIKVLFSFAKAQNYLPDEKNTAVEQIQQVRVKSDDTTIFSPAEMEKLLHHAPPDLVPILAIGAFAGIRMAEFQRLDRKFKHYRELTTPEVAEKWFSILPKPDQMENTLRYDRKKRRVILNRVVCLVIPFHPRANDRK